LFRAVYFIGYYMRFALYKPVTGTHEAKPVSVIVCAKNELNNLRRNLPVIAEQAYPEYEVIVVDDCSWDESGAYLEEMQKQYSHLRVVSIKEQERYRHGKKFALTLGIKAAKHEVLLFTDADCVPAGRNWLASMQSRYRNKTEIVLGYGPYRKEGGLLNRLIRFDAFLIAVTYFSHALAGKPYMGVGRNLSYRKPLFFRVKGFAKHNHVVSGDDDLFVNENASVENTLIETSQESFTYSDAKKTFSAWYNQKLRHTSSAKYYKGRDKFLLAAPQVFNLLFYLSLIALLATGYSWKLPVIAYGSSILVRMDPLASFVKTPGKGRHLAFPIVRTGNPCSQWFLFYC
jgi:cellulose synthase/poly-beta-1,6-N-acetylglucosamine synthase-like glycosyltransferase